MINILGTNYSINITKLYLTNYELDAFPEAILLLTKLETLDLSINRLTYIPDLSCLTSLKKLYLYSNIITLFPKLPDSIEIVDLFDNRITYIPKLRYYNLRKLDVSGNRIYHISDDLSLPLIEAMDMSDNEFTHIRTLPLSLQELDISGNYIIKMLDLSMFTSLKTLNLMYCRLTNILAMPPKLKICYLSNNQLSSLPTLPTTLKNLYLNKNRFSIFPDLSKLVNLEKLDLSINQLKVIPTYISELSNLVEISLGYNQLTSIPDNLIKLTHLKILDLYHNINCHGCCHVYNCIFNFKVHVKRRMWATKKIQRRWRRWYYTKNKLEWNAQFECMPPHLSWWKGGKFYQEMLAECE